MRTLNRQARMPHARERMSSAIRRQGVHGDARQGARRARLASAGERPTMTLSEAAVAANVVARDRAAHPAHASPSSATSSSMAASSRSRPASCNSASPISPRRAGSTAPLR